MSLKSYFDEIESLQFQIQFSVIGGIEILQLAMERHPTILALRSEVAEKRDVEDAVFNRILVLLGKIESETQLSFDESIAAYLFCLLKEKPISAYRASWRILDFGGLWWSVQLAHVVREMSREILESMDTSDNDSETVPFNSPDAASLSDEEKISIAYTTADNWDFSIRTVDQVLHTESRKHFTFGNKARAGLKSKKSFEFSDSSNRHRNLELVR